MSYNIKVILLIALNLQLTSGGWKWDGCSAGEEQQKQRQQLTRRHQEANSEFSFSHGIHRNPATSESAISLCTFKLSKLPEQAIVYAPELFIAMCFAPAQRQVIKHKSAAGRARRRRRRIIIIIPKVKESAVILFYRLPLYLHSNLPENTFRRIMYKRSFKHTRRRRRRQKVLRRKIGTTRTRRMHKTKHGPRGVHYVDDPR
jgi:hypothetical protein